MKKNIYQVVDTKARKVIEVGFESRETAKVVRNELNAVHNSSPEGNGKPRYVVSRGSDHPRGETDGIDHGYKKRTRRW